MINAYFSKRRKPKPLRTQIGNAVRELRNRQRRAEVGTATPAQNSHQRVTAPVALLLAGGIGYILLKLFSFLNSGISKKLF